MENTKELNPNEMEQVSGGTGGSPTRLPMKLGCTVYHIQAGDTLGAIARQHNTTAEQIRAVNTTISNLNDITAGYYIYVPIMENLK